MNHLKTLFHRLPWIWRLRTVLWGSSIILFLLGPVYWLDFTGDQLEAEALDRARHLTELLAVTNAEPLKKQQEIFYTINPVINESGVEEAIVADLEAMIVAPVARYGQPTNKELLNTAKKQLRIHTLAPHRYLLITPILAQQETRQGLRQRRYGYAIIRFNTATALSRLKNRSIETFKYAIWMVLALLLIEWLALRKWTQEPIKVLTQLNTQESLANHQMTANFPELQQLLEKLRSQQGEVSGSTAESIDWKNFWSQLSNIPLKSFIISNSSKNILGVQGEINQQLQTAFEHDSHLLEGLSSSPFQGALLQFIMKLEQSSTEQLPLQETLAEDLVLAGMRLDGGNETLLVISLT